MRCRRLLMIAALVLMVGAPATADAATALYPNLETLPPRSLKFDRADVSADSSGNLHNVLRFSNTVYNAGEGPLEIRATIDPSLNPPSGPAYQRIYDSAGGFTDVPLTGSTLYYHAVHKHYHFDNWGAYQLWTRASYDSWIASNESIGRPDLVGDKTTSCVEDEEFVASVAAAQWPESYPPAKCMPDSQNVIAQGLSPGWGDTYDYYRFQQWIDLGQSTLADGTYVLRSVADPDNLVYESAGKADASRESVHDNAAITTFTVSGGRILDSDVPTGTVTINHVDKTTASPRVSLDILGRDDSGSITQFRVSNDGSSWATFANQSYDSVPQTISWDLSDAAYGGSSTAGIHTVSVMFRDAAGHWGPVESDTIDYEPPAPPPPVVSAYGKAVQADGPISWWRLGESSGVAAADQSALNPGLYAGGVTLAQPSLISSDSQNTAVAFNGSSGVVKVTQASSLNLTSAVSLEAWIKPTSLPAAGAFASVLSKPESYSLQFNGPRLEFTIIQFGTRRRLQAPAGAIVAGSTYHVVGTYDGVSQRLYVNGSQVATAALSGNATTTTNALNIGSWDGASEFFRGTIDDPAIYARTLTATQVRGHYTAATTATLGAPSGLSANAGSSSQVDLTWVDNAQGETGQLLQRSTDAAFTAPTQITLAAGAESYSDTGLTPGATYYYRVKATAGTSSSPYSNVSQITMPAATSYHATVLNDRPVSYWRLDEATGTIAGDETVANPGTYAGSPIMDVPGLLASDPTDGATGFNGATSDVRIGQSGVLDLTSAMTLEASIQPINLPAAGSFRSILAKPGSYALELNGATVAFTIVQLGARHTLQAPAGTITAGSIYHLAATYDGTTQRLYVNGTQVASSALTGNADLTLAGLHIGSWDGTQQFFNGTIDDAAIYSKVLSATQVANHANAARLPLGAPSGLAAVAAASPGRIDLRWTDNASAESGEVLQRSTSSSFASPTSIALPADTQSYADTGLSSATTYWYRVEAATATDSSSWSASASATTIASSAYATAVAADGPVSWWRLGEASGTVAADQSAVNPGAYAGGATLAQPSLVATETHNTAVAFNGSTATVRVPQATSLNLTSAVSLEAWIKPTSLPATGSFASILTKRESYSLQFNGPRLEFTIIQSGIRRRLQAASGAVATGGTYHVVGTYDGTTQRLYLNGTQVASAALTGPASTTTNPLNIGSWDGATEFFRGTIDEPAVYARTLTAAQARSHYTAGTTG
jgi:hypothetical protein